MVDKPSNHPKKCFITEEDTSILLQRYTASTVLALLQEVAQVEDSKIDWNKMARKTSTGITNAREYQMLWRHLAYQDSFLDGLDHGTHPLDDDSDLECELEVFPPVSAEASAEAAACVKVLVASGLSSNSHGTNGSLVEAPLTINLPHNHASGASANHEFSSSMPGKNITVPISFRKQPLPSVNGSENSDVTGNGANKRKRKTWSEQEDQELVEVVRKHGEGNWANLIKGPFKTDRTPSQLSQRWTTLKKKGNINLGDSSHLSEAQLATRNAVLHALGDKKPVSSVKAGTHVASGNTVHPSAAESSLVGSQSRAQSQLDPSPSAAQCPVVAGTSKSRLASKKPPTKMTLSPDSMVKATAVAAGARIATPSDAASLLMAAQSKNAVHIKAGGGSMMKSSMPGNVNQLPSNVHFMSRKCKPLHANPSMSNASRLGSSQEVLANTVKPEIAAVQSNQDDIILGLGASTQVVNGAASNDASTGHAARVPAKSNHSEAVPSTLMLEACGNQTVSGSLTGQDQIDQSSSPPNNLSKDLDDDKRSTLGTEVKEHL